MQKLHSVFHSTVIITDADVQMNERKHTSNLIKSTYDRSRLHIFRRQQPCQHCMNENQ